MEQTLNWCVKILPQIWWEWRMQGALAVCPVEAGKIENEVHEQEDCIALALNTGKPPLTSTKRCGWLEHFSEENCGRGWLLEQSLRTLSIHFSFLSITVPGLKANVPQL